MQFAEGHSLHGIVLNLVQILVDIDQTKFLNTGKWLRSHVLERLVAEGNNDRVRADRLVVDKVAELCFFLIEICLPLPVQTSEKRLSLIPGEEVAENGGET